ncbi:hypothetical protein ACHAWF_016065 [Thalassiosira exigua]
MSMTSLGGQLAALSTARTSSSAGFVQSTSRATNDAVGRGFGHSSRHGGGGLGGGGVGGGGGGSEKSRPSILCDSAREAAEVSASTLRIGAVEALRRLGDAAAASTGSEAVREMWNDPEFVGSEGLLSAQKLEGFERDAASPARNAEIDASIEKLLDLVATMVAECPPPSSEEGEGGDLASNPVLLSCLRVVEYLVRHYAIHARSNTALMLLRTFLPLQIAHPTGYPQVFSRILSLVDLQRIPEWTFLRPYAARGSAPVTGRAIAKQMARDDALVKVAIEMGRRAMELSLREGKLVEGSEVRIDGADDGGGGTAKAAFVRRGASAALSSSASVLVEALHVQATSRDAGYATGGVRENTVRTLFPAILSACKSGREGGGRYCAEWKEWGRLLASTLASSSSARDDVATALCDAIADGLPARRRGSAEGGRSFGAAAAAVANGGGGAAMTAKESDDAGSAVLTLLSVLGSSEGGGDDDDDDKDDGGDEGWEGYLPMLPPGRRDDGARVVDHLGCDLPPSTYKRLSRAGGVAAAGLGEAVRALRGGDDEDDEDEASGRDALAAARASPLLAALVARALRRLEAEAAKPRSSPEKTKKNEGKKKGKGTKSVAPVDGGADDAAEKCKADRDVLLILGLIREPSLSPLWRADDSALAAAAAARTVASYDEGRSSPHRAAILERYRAVLGALRELDPAAHDRGVAHFVEAVSDADGPRAARVARLLGRDGASPSPGKGAASEKGGKGAASKDSASATLLPPRAALEHADPSVRLDAVSRLNEAVENGEEGSDADLGRALLRRIRTDDDAAVAAAAGNLLARELGKLPGSKEGEEGTDVDGDDEAPAFEDLADDADALAEEALAALARWTYVGKDDDDGGDATSTKSPRRPSKKSKGNAIEHPLLPCVSICGSVARLLLEGSPVEGTFVGGDDADLVPLRLRDLFLGLGAHVDDVVLGTEGRSSRLIGEVSRMASEELRHLLGGKEGVDAADLIVTHPMGQKVLAVSFCGREEGMPPSALPGSLQLRILRCALRSCSEKLSSESSLSNKELVDMAALALDMLLYRLRSYAGSPGKNDSYEKEEHFLSEVCRRCLTFLIAEGDGRELEKSVMKLASTSSHASFDGIVKPVVTTLFSSSDSKTTHGDASILLNACLQPNGGMEGILRLLDIANETIGNKSTVAKASIIPTLALLAHPERKVRERAIGTLELLRSLEGEDLLPILVSKATDRSSPLRSSLVIDGADALPQLLAQAASSSPTDPLQNYLLEACKSCCLDEKAALSDGRCEATAMVMLAMEQAGEETFPLLQRWDEMGRNLFGALLAYDREEASASLSLLRDCILNMLKGVLVKEAQSSIQIMIGPSSTGGRKRSYSIGASESFTTLTPYPNSMLESILEGLSAPNSSLRLSKNLVKLVISRPSWSNGVFPKLKGKWKNAVASALLMLRTRNDDESAGAALLGLSLKCSDFIQLLKGATDAQPDLHQSSILVITDCILGKLDVLGSNREVNKLSSELFDQLLSMSLVKVTTASDGGGRDYTRVKILQTLLSVHTQYQLSHLEKDGSNHSSPRRKRSRSHSDVGGSNTMASQADLLVGLLGGNQSVLIPLHSGRGRALSLSLLTCLCEESPSMVVPSLLPALMNLAEDVNALGDALAAIVPSYCKHAPAANLSITNLLESFLGRIVSVADNETSKFHLLDCMVDALKSLPTKEMSSDAIASLAACSMALQARTGDEGDEKMSNSDVDSPTRLDLRVLARTTTAAKIAVSRSLLQYAEDLLSYVYGVSALPADSKMRTSTLEVASLALRGPDLTEGITPSVDYSKLSSSRCRAVLCLTINLLQSVRDTLSSPAVRRSVRKSRGDDANLCLRLWDGLMNAHANAVRARAELVDKGKMGALEKRFWDAVPAATGECLERLQNLLPVPHFLASVSSAFVDESADSYIRKKAIKLLADRVVEINADSPEAALFLEMVPDLVAQVTADRPKAEDGEGSSALIRRTIIIQQGALIAIETFARSLYPSSESSKQAATAAAAFLPALSAVAKVLDSAASAIGENLSLGMAEAECQLISSSSLCASRLVTTLKARCLPQLPAIIKPLIASLKAVNSLLSHKDETNRISSTGHLLQLSILRTLSDIAQTLPQFLLPHLPSLFSNNALPSKALRLDNDGGNHSVSAAATQLEHTLATKVNIRQLVPVLSQSLSKNLSDGDMNWEDACSTINVMHIAVESAPRSQLTPVIGKIFRGLVMAYGYEGDDICRAKMLQQANKCLLSLVMKLSEAQLRSLYARLRNWRGDIEEESKTESSSVRRFAFWSLSAELSKSLRSIFLPCLASVLADVFDELELAVASLCKSSKKEGGSKRRRVEEASSTAEDIEKVKSLQPLLMCLTSAFKADAHEGGDWTRGDDNQRYNIILSHLGKLLLAQVPQDLPLLSDQAPNEQASTSAYRQLVLGMGTLEHGNVVGCITALAAAAGNEQLWKPLNFSVLEACGNKRSEVRRAGVGCLLSLIDTIGEEYMVLLPECLPVLSELLEDDEEIASLAKQCVQQGEELLGESLEESLR